MPRVYKRKTQRDVDEVQIKRAIKDHFENKIAVREVARNYNIKRSTLMSRIKNIKQKGYQTDEIITKFQNKYTTHQVLSTKEENDLVYYIKKCSDLHYGLSYRQIREIACEYAVVNSCRYPKSWKEKRLAGLDWLYGFMGRHPDLSLRRPESTSLLRSTGFNKKRVEDFFNNYIAELTKYNFTGAQIYNLDETGVETVLKPVKIVTQKGKKQVGQVASAERGELVTFVGIINALGNSVPPVYIVPRLRNPSDYIQGAPASSLVLGNKTGWMTKELFLEVLKHIIKHTRCSKENRILILMDNHSSHTSYEAIKFCKESGISLLSFPPHSSHRMQPLDVGVFGPFKTATSVAFNDWLVTNPGEVITIRRIGELTNKAYIRSFTMSNIINSFRKPGIWPVDRLAFTEEDFAPSSIFNASKSVINSSEEKTPETENNASNIISQENSDDASIIIHSNILINQPSTSHQKDEEISRKEHKSFETLRPFPNVAPKVKKRKNKTSKSKIYTSTPEMEEMERAIAESERKASLKLTAKKRRNTKPPVKRALIEKEDTPESDTEHSLELMDTDDDASSEEFPLLESGCLVRQGDFIIVKFATKSTVVYYVGQVLSVAGVSYEVKFLRRKTNSNTFVFPPTDDISEVERDDILGILPRTQNTGTARTADLYSFNFNLKAWNIR